MGTEKVRAMEGTCLVYFLTVFAAFVAVCMGERGQLILKAAETEVKRGEQIQISCDVVTWGDSQSSFIAWYKIIENEEPKIATNNILEKTHAGLEDRYAFSHTQPKDHVFNITLTISNADVQDSGKYRCESSSGMLKEEVSIIVQVEPTSLEFKIDLGDGLKAVSDEMTEEFNQGAKIKQFQCIVKGGYPRPEILVLSGDKDITNKFTATPDDEALKRTKTSYPGLEKMAYDVVLNANNFAVAGKLGNKPMRCEARVPWMENAVLQSKTFTPTFKGFKPEFDCYESKISYRGEKNVDITCQVKAKPHPDLDQMSFYWLRGSGKVNTTLGMKEQDGAYRSDFTTDGDYLNITLYIDGEVKEQMFREYYFNVENTFGSAHWTVELIRDKSLEPEADGASQIAMSVLGMFLTVALLFHL